MRDVAQHVGLGIQAAHHDGEEGEGTGVGRKGMGKERTFQAIEAWPDLKAKCEEIAHALAEDMLSEGLKAKTLTLKVRTRLAPEERGISG